MVATPEETHHADRRFFPQRWHQACRASLHACRAQRAGHHHRPPRHRDQGTIPALYAAKLADKGLTVLTFDAAFQGESEGLPRGREDPAQRIEDIKAAVSFLSTLPGIAAERIGVLGICASGGYAIAAAAGDRRIRAVASVAAVDVGLQMRVGADGQQDPAVLDALLEGAAQARSRAARGEAMGALPVFPANEEEARAGGQHVFEGWDYYCTPRAQHPRSARALSWDSLDRMATFDAFRFIDMIAPRPC
jgi:fermentation-respiration switch protein FrsA (DUF1100 family)